MPRKSRPIQSEILVLALMLGLTSVGGCGPGQQTAPSSSTAKPDPSQPAGVAVREAIAKVIGKKVDPLPLDQPLASPPLKADDLDLVEAVMEIEERLDIEIRDEDLERAAGAKGVANLSRYVTPAMLISLAEKGKARRVQRGKRG
jgi:acyl carrier protein